MTEAPAVSAMQSQQQLQQHEKRSPQQAQQHDLQQRRRAKAEEKRKQLEMAARLRAAEENFNRTQRLHQELSDRLRGGWDALSQEEREAELQRLAAEREDLLSKSGSNVLKAAQFQDDGVAQMVSVVPRAPAEGGA